MKVRLVEFGWFVSGEEDDETKAVRRFFEPN